MQKLKSSITLSRTDAGLGLQLSELAANGATLQLSLASYRSLDASTVRRGTLA